MQVQLKKPKKTEEAIILERMKQMQIQQIELAQTSAGWINPLHSVQAHVDLDAIELMHNVKSQDAKEDDNCLIQR